MVESKKSAYSIIAFSFPGRACKKKNVRAGEPPPKPPNIICGGVASLGRVSTRVMRLITSINVCCISVSTLNSRLIKALPRLANAFICVKPGIPLKTCSCGSTISDSISIGEAARQVVCTAIRGRSISGNN